MLRLAAPFDWDDVGSWQAVGASKRHNGETADDNRRAGVVFAASTATAVPCGRPANDHLIGDDRHDRLRSCPHVRTRRWSRARMTKRAFAASFRPSENAGMSDSPQTVRAEFARPSPVRLDGSSTAASRDPTTLRHRRCRAGARLLGHRPHGTRAGRPGRDGRGAAGGSPARDLYPPQPGAGRPASDRRDPRLIASGRTGHWFAAAHGGRGGAKGR